MRGATHGTNGSHRVSRFLLTRPMRGATFTRAMQMAQGKFLLTRPMRGATMKIVAPRAFWIISTHTPHAGRDRAVSCRSFFVEFLLTRPMRGATKTTRRHQHDPQFLLTRPMRGATGRFVITGVRWAISTHTPHAGRDLWNRSSVASAADFYSHAPCGARQLHIVYVTPAPPIYKRRTQKL